MCPLLESANLCSPLRYGDTTTATTIALAKGTLATLSSALLARTKKPSSLWALREQSSCGRCRSSTSTPDQECMVLSGGAPTFRLSVAVSAACWTAVDHRCQPTNSGASVLVRKTLHGTCQAQRCCSASFALLRHGPCKSAKRTASSLLVPVALAAFSSLISLRFNS